MPELPEVETVARQLAASVVGRRVRGFRILDPLLRNGRTPRVAGRRIVSVRRSGKQVLLELSPREDDRRGLWLAVHLRMTGRLIHDERGEAAGRQHLRARFRLDRGQLVFRDARRFGTMRWHRSPDEAAPAGVEPLSAELTPARLAELLGSTSQSLKAWLLRQDRLVGLGNIYASEILHAARLSPRRRAGRLRRAEIRRLHGSIVRILERAVRNCGTTFSDFQDARGVEGGYQSLLAVYGREGRPCRRCRSIVRRIVQQQRSTFYCPGCQR